MQFEWGSKEVMEAEEVPRLYFRLKLLHQYQ